MARKSQNRELKTIRQRYQRKAKELEQLAERAGSKETREQLLNRRQSALEKAEQYKSRGKSESEIDQLIKAGHQESLKITKGGEALQTMLLRTEQRPSSGRSSFYASTKDIWVGETAPAKRDEVILNYFGVNTLEEAMEKLGQALGDSETFFDKPEMNEEEKYKTVALKGAVAIANWSK